MIAAGDARRFVAEAEAWRVRGGETNPAWQREAVALLVAADGIDLDVAGVRAAITAEAAVCGSTRVGADAYIEGFRREALRRLEVWVSESGHRWDRGTSAGRRL